MCHGQILNEQLRKARKLHECRSCTRPIPPGQEYVSRVWSFDGSLGYAKFCKTCFAKHEVMQDADGDSCRPFVVEDDSPTKDIASYLGWKTMRAKMKAALDSLRSR